MAQEQSSYGVSTALTALRRGVVPIVLCGVLLAIAAAYVTSRRDSDDWTANAVLLGRDPGFAGVAFEPDTPISSRDEQVPIAALANLRAVAHVAAEELGGGMTAAEVSDHIVITDFGSGLISVGAKSPDADEAARIANAYAEATMEQRVAAEMAVIDEAIARAERRIDGMSAGSAEARGLQERIEQLEAFRDFQTGDLERVQRADPSDATRASEPPVLKNAVAGGVAGLLLGMAAVLLLDRIRPRLAGRERAEQVFGAPVIATIGRGGGGDFDEARARLVHRRGAGAPSSVLVLPAAGVDGAAVAAGLADALARSGRRALLVDARLGEGSGGEGLAQVLAGDARARDAIAAGGEGSADRLGSGGPRDDGASVLGRPRAADELRALIGDYEVVVVAGPGASAEAIPLVGATEVTVAVAADGGDERECEALARDVRSAGGDFAGVVLLRG